MVLADAELQIFVFFKQKTAYEMRISDWSSDVCSSDLLQTWERVTSTPRFLSLSAEIGTYAGGAHGMQSFDTLIWDRNRRKRMKPLDLFQSSAAFDAAVRDAFCAGIKRAKAAKGIEEAPDSVFAE